MLDGPQHAAGNQPELGFTAEERSENLRRSAEVAKLLNEAGLICIAAFVAPSEEVRQRAREVVGRERFLVVHVATPLEACRRARCRRVRTRKADSGEIVNFPGVSRPYEAPARARPDPAPDQSARRAVRRPDHGNCSPSGTHTRRHPLDEVHLLRLALRTARSDSANVVLSSIVRSARSMSFQTDNSTREVGVWCVAAGVTVLARPSMTRHHVGQRNPRPDA